MQRARLRKFMQYYMIFIGIFGQLVFYAQAYKIFTTQSAEDVSVLGFSFGLVSVASWFAYGVMLKDVPLIVANVFAVVGASLVLIGTFLHG